MIHKVLQNNLYGKFQQSFRFISFTFFTDGKNFRLPKNSGMAPLTAPMDHYYLDSFLKYLNSYERTGERFLFFFNFESLEMCLLKPSFRGRLTKTASILAKIPMGKFWSIVFISVMHENLFLIHSGDQHFLERLKEVRLVKVVEPN